MKIFVVCMCGLLAITVAARSGCAATPATEPTTSQALAALPASGDAGTDMVVAFYKALLQEEPPTLAQEAALFGDMPGVRHRLIKAGQGTAKDAVVLQFFRTHREWFVPKKMKSPHDIGVSSTWHVVQTLGLMKGPPQEGQGCVSVFLSDGVEKPRTIVFFLTQGKLEYGMIYLDGYGEHSTQSEFMKVHYEGEMKEFGSYKDTVKPAPPAPK